MSDDVATLYAWAGGEEAFERLINAFYDRVENDELLSPMFPGGVTEQHRRHVVAWWCEVFGGPAQYTDELGGYQHMLHKHRDLSITPEQRFRFASLMSLAADDAGLPDDPEFRSAFVAYVEWGTRLALHNSQPGASVAEQAPVPRWGWGEAPPYQPIAATDPTAIAELLDYRRQVAELYAEIRAAPDPRRAHAQWCDTRRRLYATHPQSPVPAGERARYDGPHVWDYDPSWRLLATVQAAPAATFELPSSDGATMRFIRFARARTDRCSLDLFWLDAYGGGLFVPFADETSASESYGAGRYALDTIKGADLGTENGLLVLDLNFAYQPSCSYDPQWTCPLAPPANRLDVPVRAGERHAPAQPNRVRR